MNERIEKLISEAIKAIPDHVDFDLPKEFTQKFAELIVRECVDLLWNSLSISADHDGTVDGIEYTGKEILTAVKEYFGVES